MNEIETESELVTKVKALPMRERLLWFDLTLTDQTVEEVARKHGLPIPRMLEMLREINIRLGMDE